MAGGELEKRIHIALDRELHVEEISALTLPLDSFLLGMAYLTTWVSSSVWGSVFQEGQKVK